MTFGTVPTGALRESLREWCDNIVEVIGEREPSEMTFGCAPKFSDLHVIAASSLHEPADEDTLFDGGELVEINEGTIAGARQARPLRRRV